MVPRGGRGARRAWVPGLALAGLVASACAGLGGTGSSAAGSAPGLGVFAVTSPVLGDRSVAPAECASGQREIFFGADFIDPATKIVVRLVVDPLAGPSAKLFEHGHADTKSVIVRRSDCATFHASMERTGVKIGDIRVFRVALELDCRLADGTSVRGRAAAACS